jgi:plastocyanin domain-containing protein
MTLAQIVVTVVGVAASALVLWYFVFTPGPALAAAAKGGVQEVRITVKGGYTPDTVVVRAGKPVRLLFYRDETADCSERLVLEGFGVDRPLPAFQTTAVEFTPSAAGEFLFRCGLDTMKGLLVVEPSTPAKPVASPHKHHG